MTSVSRTLAACMAAVWSPGIATVRPTGVACCVTKVEGLVGRGWAARRTGSAAQEVGVGACLLRTHSACRLELLWQPPPLRQWGHVHQR